MVEERQPTTAFVALGSNLDRPEHHIARGLREMEALPATTLVRSSALYRSAAVGHRDQPDFINAVAELRTTLAPRALLDHLLAIERAHGRLRAFPNAPRTLDLDIVLYGNRVVREPGLVIPHPRMHERAFVMVPLAEIAPDAVIPGRGSARGLLGGVDGGSVTRMQPGD
ncbi:MAG: 2-amino-4-hydroxy-6-hydroxymethyldihydropteridine diphosphokinase [Betaproteobacteria bacterium]